MPHSSIDVPQTRVDTPALASLFKGAHILIRALQERDALDVHRLANDWEVVRMLSNLPFPYPRGLAETWILSTQRQARVGTAWHFAIERDGVLLGCIGVTYERLRKSARVGYWIGRAYWGQGIAKHAVTQVVQWAFDHLQIQTVYAEVSIDNAASIAVLTRLGFSKIGTDARHLVSRGSKQPVAIYEKTSPCDTCDGVVGMQSKIADTLPDDKTSGLNAVVTPKILLVVAVVLIDPDERILLATRPEGKSLAGLWEFPGGKIEPHESPESALAREIREELAIEIDPTCLAPFTFASHALGERHLMMPLYLCRKWHGTPRAAEGQRLAWVTLDEISSYSMPEADAPLIPLLRAFL